MSEAFVERVVKGYDAFNRREVELALVGLSEDILWIGPDMLPEGQREFRGHQGVQQFWEMWYDVFEEFRAEIEEVIDAGEQVVVMVRIHGRHKDSGSEVVTPSFPHVWSFENREVVRMEMFPNRAAALEAIGLESA